MVADGSHIDADTPYAEVEVMKMCMPLLSPASGVIHFQLSEGQAMQVSHIPNRVKTMMLLLQPKEKEDIFLLLEDKKFHFLRRLVNSLQGLI